MDYMKQGTDFLAKHGLKFRATRYPDDMQVAAPWCGDHKPIRGPRTRQEYDCGLRYRITIWRDGKPGRLSFDYWGSIADRDIIDWKVQAGALTGTELADYARARREPSAYSVLACISGDQHCADTFAEFCGEFGYDTDSIQARRTFKRCKRFAKRIQAFFTSDELVDLAEIN